MNEENQTQTTVNEKPPKKNGGTAKKVIIAIVALVVIAAIVFGILWGTGVFKINVTKKSKMVAGVEKIGETFTNALDEINSAAEKEGGAGIKILDKIDLKSPIEYSGELSANIDSFDVSGIDATTKKSILSLANASKIGMDVRADGKGKAYASINGKVDDIELSGEAVYDGEKLALRSEEINPKWISISKDEINTALKSEGVDIDEILETSSKMIDRMMQATKEMQIDEKTQKEIEERYEKVLKDFINEKAKDIEAEKAKVEVNGKEKSCEKLTLELKDKDLRELLTTYVDTFKDDEQLQGLVKKMFSSYTSALSDISEMTGEAVDTEYVVDSLNEVFDELDSIKESIEEIEFDGKIIIAVYATNTETYRTDISIEIEDATINLEITYNDNETVIEINGKAAGTTIDIAKATIKSDKNSIGLKIETSSFVEEYLGTKMSAEINYKIESNKEELLASFDLGSNGKGTIKVNTTTNKNEENEYNADTTISLDVDIPSEATIKGELTYKNKIKVGDVSIPTVSEKETVDTSDPTALQTYQTESQENMTKLMENVQKNKVLSGLIENIEL